MTIVKFISKFNKILANHWQELGNRRKFFEDYAGVNGFDPLVPENWYSVQTSKLLSISVLYFFDQFALALTFDTGSIWSSSALQQQFIESLGGRISGHWY